MMFLSVCKNLEQSHQFLGTIFLRVISEKDTVWLGMLPFGDYFVFFQEQRIWQKRFSSSSFYNTMRKTYDCWLFVHHPGTSTQVLEIKVLDISVPDFSFTFDFKPALS